MATLSFSVKTVEAPLPTGVVFAGYVFSVASVAGADGLHSFSTSKFSPDPFCAIEDVPPGEYVCSVSDAAQGGEGFGSPVFTKVTVPDAAVTPPPQTYQSAAGLSVVVA